MPSTDVQIQGLMQNALIKLQLCMRVCWVTIWKVCYVQFDTLLCPNVLTVIIYTNDANETKGNNKLQAYAESFDLIWVYTSSENYYHLQYEITSFFPTAYSSIRTLSPHRSVINCLAWKLMTHWVSTSSDKKYQKNKFIFWWYMKMTLPFLNYNNIYCNGKIFSCNITGQQKWT